MIEINHPVNLPVPRRCNMCHKEHVIVPAGAVYSDDEAYIWSCDGRAPDGETCSFSLCWIPNIDRTLELMQIKMEKKKGDP